MAVLMFGYEDAPAVWDEVHMDWFSEKSEQIGKDLHLHFCRGGTKTRCSLSEEPNQDVVEILDFAAIGDNTTLRERDYLYLTIPEDLRGDDDLYAADDEGDHSFCLRHYRSLIPSGAHPQMWLSDRGEDDLDHTDNMSLGNMEFQTLWFKTPMTNFQRYDSGTILDWIRHGDGDELEMIMHLFVGQFIDKSLDREYFDGWAEVRRSEMKRLFLESTRVQLQAQLTARQHAVTQLEQQQGQLQEQLVQNEIALREKARALRLATTINEEDLTEADKAFDALDRNALVKNLALKEGARSTIEITTPHLYLHNPDRTERVPLGTMRIDLDLSTRKVKIFNLTNTKATRQHPHVPSDGTPCWGGIEVAMRNLLKDWELPAMVDIIVGFLESYNPADSWGIWGGLWFEDKDQIEIKVDGEWVKKKDHTPDTSIAEAMMSELEA